MKSMTFAAIDIGSNAVRLLIKKASSECCDTSHPLKKLLMLRVPLRLGFDVFLKGRISDKKKDNLVRLMKAYRQLLRIYEVDRLRACATSAMRDASNGKEIIQEIEEETDIRIEIIAGEEEARIIFDNHLEQQNTDSDGNYLYVDVGGGSTELNFIHDGQLTDSRSFNIGTVRILSGKVRPQEWAGLNRFLEKLRNDNSGFSIIGSGGNINKLYRLAQTKDEENKSFSIEELSRLYHLLRPLSVEQRMKRFDLKPDRADVIIPAAEIFLNIASVLQAETIIVPVIGVADGIIDGLYKKYLC